METSHHYTFYYRKPFSGEALRVLCKTISKTLDTSFSLGFTPKVEAYMLDEKALEIVVYTSEVRNLLLHDIKKCVQSVYDMYNER